LKKKINKLILTNKNFKKMKLFRIYLTAALIAAIMTSCGKFGGKAKMTTENDSVSYYLGIYSGMELKRIQVPMPNINFELYSKAVKEVFESKDGKINMQEASMYLNKYFTKIMAKENEKYLKEGEEFMAKNKIRSGVITTASGLQYEVIKEGNGKIPKADDMVSVQYTGKLLDGTVFDSSIERGKPVTMPVSGVIKGWQEILQMMKVGSKYKLYVPSNLAYGQNSPGGKIKPNMTLIFDMELMSIEPKQAGKNPVKK
jgi:FKBP-type peptidyl-prolyl cis-trans isomerase